ncbi:hypothetical protein PISMIDRAFT_101099, partial [Pisolithus microcarpus 441]
MEKDIQGAGPPTEIFEEPGNCPASYVILSHCWERGEVELVEMRQLTSMDEPNRNQVRQRAGYNKIIKSCEQAMKDGCTRIWIDTCCIDRQNQFEFEGAINSMYQWYHKSQKCYAYLSDVEDSFPARQDFHKYDKTNGWPAWFSRGWTLQELIAPKQVEFFNKDWVYIGDKESLAKTLEIITRIPVEVLKKGRIPRHFCAAQIMSWAADRKTTWVEDRAYSLIGLFDVYLPKLYGVGKNAFQELQVKIIEKYKDQSIFAWNPKGQFGKLGGVLADDPSYFRGCQDI